MFRRLKADCLVLGTILTLSLASIALATGQQAKLQQITGLEQPIHSPDGRFELLYMRNATKPDEQYHEIWLRSPADLSKQTLLYSYGRGVEVLWSPDSTMVAITDQESSSDSFVKVFRISSPSTFTEIKEVQPFVDSHAKKMLSQYDHFYAEVVAWPKDSKFLIIRLRGDFAELEGKRHEAQKKVTFTIPKKK